MFINFVLVLLTLLVESAVSVCPADLVTEVSTCFTNLTGSTEHVMAGADVEQLLAQCRQGQFATTVQCIEGLYNQCPHHNDRTILQQLASPHYMRESFRVFCSNFDHYANSSSCIRSLDAEMKDCLNKQLELLHFQIQNRKILQDILPVYCEYLHQTTCCIEKPVRRECDSRTADIIVVFADGLTPPMCDRYLTNANTINTVSITILTLNFAFFIFLF